MNTQELIITENFNKGIRFTYIHIPDKGNPSIYSKQTAHKLNMTKIRNILNNDGFDDIVKIQTNSMIGYDRLKSIIKNTSYKVINQINYNFIIERRI